MSYGKLLISFFILLFQLEVQANCPAVIASFSVNQTAFCGAGPHAVTLTNTSSGTSLTGLTFSWYADGVLFNTTTAVAQPANFSLSGYGPHVFSLIVSDPSVPCTDTMNINVGVYVTPSASFTIPSGSFCTNNNINFNSTSAGTNSSTTYLWDFGNGATSSAQNPVYGFPGSGTFTVTLTTTNGPSCSSSTTQNITISAGPQINISGDDGDGNTTYCLFPADNTTSESVIFSNSTTNAVSYLWNFGDGTPTFSTTSTANFTHVYTSYGTFIATMTATSANGCQDTDTIVVVFEKYVSSGLTLNITEYSGCIPHSITTLTNLSVNATNFTWNFGDGTIVTTNSAIPPPHQYTTGGTYTITLTAANSCNSSNATISPITIISSPVVNFTPSLFTGCAPQTVTFTNSSTNVQPPNNYQWNMGNGNSYVNIANPGGQLYWNAGTYTVELIAGNACGYDTVEHLIVLDTIPTVNLTLNPSEGCTPLTVDPTAVQLYGNSVAWSWAVDGAFYSAAPNDIPNQVFTSNNITDTTLHTIRVTVSNSCGSNTDLDSAIVHPLVQANFSSADTACVNSTINFTDLSEGSDRIYSWNFGDGSPLNSSPNPTHAYALAGTYIATLTLTGYCGTDVFFKTIEIVDIPTISIAGSPVLICNSDSVTFTNSSSTAGNLLWDFGTNASSQYSTLYSPGNVAFFGSGITHKVFFSINDGGCTNIDSLDIVMSTSPDANFTVSPNNGCSPVNPALTNTTIDDVGQTYTWNYGNGTTSFGIAPINQTYSSVLVDTVYQISLLVENAAGCTDSTVQNVSVYALPIAGFTQSDDTLCAGQGTTFTNTSTHGNSYNWSFGDGGASNALSLFYTYMTPGNYTVQLIAHTTHGCHDTTWSNMQIDSVPSASFTASSVCLGNPTSFSLNTISYQTVYTWDFGDGTPLVVGPNPQHQYATSGNYTVSVTALNAYGCSHTATGSVSVQTIPAPAFTWTPTCLGTAMTFANQTPGFFNTHNWNFGDGTTASGFNATHIFGDTGFFNVKLISTIPFGCSDSLVIPVYIDSVPSANFTFVSTCSGDSTVFINTSTFAPADYSWTFGDGNTSTFFAPSNLYTVPTSYSVTLTVTYPWSSCSDQITQIVESNPHTVPDFSTANSCFGDQMVFTDLTTNSPTSWEWNFGDGTPLAYNQSPTHFFASSGIYNVSLVTTNVFGCSDTITYPIQIFDNPTALFGANTICQGDSTIFTNNSINYVSSVWNFGDASIVDSNNNTSHVYATDGTFSVELIVSSGVGCVDTIQQNVIVNPNPVSSYSADSICLGLGNTFSDLSTGANNWQYDFGDGTFGTNQNETHNYLNSGTFITEQLVTNIFGCQDSSNQTIVVFALPVADFSAATVCEDDSTLFIDQSIGNITTWNWDFDDAGSVSVVQNPAHVYTTGGTFNVTLLVQDTNNCADDTTRIVTTIAKPLVDFAFDTVCHNSITHFNDLSVDTLGVTSWSYSFGELLNMSGAQNPSYIYQNPGNYTVQLTATNSFGCFDTVSHLILVEPNPLAAFGFDTVCLGNTTTFLNFSTGTGSTFTWDFGDGSPTSNVQNPQHQYATAGTYLVTLTAVSPFGCAHTVSHLINVLNSPSGNFSWSPTCLGNAMTFSNQTPGTFQTYSWNFGDGNTSGIPSPNHTYADTGAYSVQLFVTNSLGCSDSITMPVYVDSIPVVDFSYASVCSGDTTVFTNLSTANPSNYVWDFGDGNTSTLFSPQHVYATANSYTTTLLSTYANGCSSQISHLIDAYPHTVPNFSSVNYCLSDQTSFTDLSTASATSWEWIFGDGSASIFTQSPTHVYGAAGLYNVALITTNAFGCSDTLTQQIEIHSLPTINFSATTSCEGASTIFTNTSTNYTTTTWDFGDGSPINLNVAPTHLYATNGTFSVKLILTSIHGCMDSLSQNVTVNPNPTASFTVDSVCFGSTNTFTDLSTNAVSWQYNFGDGSSGTNQNETHTYLTAGTFLTKQIVSNAFGCQDSTTLTLLVHALPVAHFSANAVCEDAVMNFVNLSIGTGNTYAWDFDDLGATSNLQNPTHIYANAGSFNVTLMVTDINGCIDSTLIAVTTVAKPTVNFSFDTACHMSQTHFIDLSSDPLGITSWNFNFGDGGNQSLAQNPNYIYSVPGIFQTLLTATNSFGCSDTVSHFVYVEDIPNPQFVSDTVCLGNPSTFTDLSTGVITSWDWSFGDGTTQSSSGNTSHTYLTPGNFLSTLQLNALNMCPASITHSVHVYQGINPVIGAPATACENGLVQFSDITPPSTTVITNWAWDFGDGTTSNLMNPTHTFTTFGNYYVTLTVTTSTGCFGTSGINIAIQAPPALVINSNTPCEGQSTNLFATTNQILGSWTWNFDDGSAISNLQSPSHIYPSAGNYTVSLNVISNNGCTANTSSVVTINPSPTANFTYTAACPGDPVNFTNTSVGSIANYQWIFNNTVVSTTQNTSYSFPDTADQHMFSLVVSSALGCIDTITQIIINHPIVNFNYGPLVASGCEVFSATFADNSTTTGGGITNWVWDFGDGFNAFSQNPNHVFENAGTYTIGLSVTTAEGCQFTDILPFPVLVYPKPVAGFSYPMADYDLNNPIVSFLDNSQGASLWEWEFGDSYYSNEINPVHTYNDSGVFLVTQIVHNQYGCSDTAVSSVHIKNSSNVYVPNSFTPDGDEWNQYFTVKGTGILGFNLYVYDRWGEIISVTNQLDPGWGGDYEGKPCQDGVYTWKLIYLDHEGDEQVKYGHVTLIRE